MNIYKIAALMIVSFIVSGCATLNQESKRVVEFEDGARFEITLAQGINSPGCVVYATFMNNTSKNKKPILQLTALKNMNTVGEKLIFFPTAIAGGTSQARDSIRLPYGVSCEEISLQSSYRG